MRHEFDYDWLWKAAAEYFQALETLQTGQFNQSDFKAAFDNLRQSELHTLHVRQEDRGLFFEFRREATTIGAAANAIHIGPDQNKAELLKTLWQTERTAVVGLYENVKDRFYTRLQG